MSKKIIGMISSYPKLNPSAADWLWHQTPNPFGEWGNVQMLATHPQPDFLLFYNFFTWPSRPEYPKPWSYLKAPQKEKRYQQELAEMQAKLRGVPQERCIFLWREPPLDEVLPRTIRHYQSAKKYCGYISGPDDYAPQPDYMPAIWYLLNEFRDFNDLESPEKIKPCSWIVSGVNRAATHQKRFEFMQSLVNAQLDVDLYGRNLPDWTKSCGSLGNKWHGMAPYYYNLTIENYAENDWYVTEKLWDALLCWCLPIYYGGTAPDKLLPPGSFLRLPSLDEKGIQFIQEVTATPDAWYEAKEAIAEARQIVLHKLNLLEWLSNFVAKF